MQTYLSQLSHVELLTPTPEASVEFFADVIGLEQIHREGQSTWFRGWGEWLHSSLVVTEAPTSGLGHIGWRTQGPEELEQVVAALTASGLSDGWTEGAPGHGPAFRFHSPDGHVNEVFWEVERYQAPEALRSRYPTRPQRYFPRGAGARRIDHVTLGVRDAAQLREFYASNLRFRHMESFGAGPARELASFLSTNASSHDLGLITDPTGSVGRLNHVAFWLDSEIELRRAADILVEHPAGLHLGPERHGLGENFCLYTREPGGNYVELFTGPGYFNYMPDWEPVYWNPPTYASSYYGRPLPEAFLPIGSPPAEMAQPPLEAGAEVEVPTT